MTIFRPRPNRVTPFGAFERSEAKGLLVGNRGDLHAANGTLGPSRWKSTAWISCSTAIRSDYRIEFDRRGTYFPLFFSDESVALAAGHRPCAKCRRDDWTRFKAAWRQALGLVADTPVMANLLDRQLHKDRVIGRRLRRHEAAAGSLPAGTFVCLPGDSSRAARVVAGGLRPWSHEGYQDLVEVAPSTRLEVLTPPLLVAVLAAGYQPRDT